MTEITCCAPVAQTLIAWVSATRQNLRAKDVPASRLDEMRLEDLVLNLLDMDVQEAKQMDALADSNTPFERSPKRFNETLQQAIRQLGLFRLFTTTHDGEYHRGICPAAYNERTGEHHPQEMAQWRADFRAMSPEQQMVAATMVWMYRAGPDSIWLRRVSCTWKASEALHYMRDAGCLAIWLKLVARYPGW